VDERGVVVEGTAGTCASGPFSVIVSTGALGGVESLATVTVTGVETVVLPTLSVAPAMRVY